MRQAPAGILITVEEAAGLFKVPRGTLYRWAHEDGWTRYGGPRSCHWLIDDVETAYKTRRERPDLPAKIAKAKFS